MQAVRLRGVFGFYHALGQFTQLLRAEQTALRDLPGELDYLDLFGARQALDLFDDFNRCHVGRLLTLEQSARAARAASLSATSLDGMIAP